MSAARFTALLALAAASAGCGGTTRYTPSAVAPGEITFRANNGIELWAGDRRVADAHRYEGLADFVACVPAARQHAALAESNGLGGTILTYAGGGFALGGLAGLGGLAYFDKDDQKMFTFFSVGITAEIVGIVLAGVGRKVKLQATGHAVDAANYYNDAVGSVGGKCPPPP